MMPIDVPLLVRYGVTGVFGALMQVVVLWLWVGVFGQRDQYLWGVAFGFVCALATTFPIQKYWAFRDASHRAAPRQFLWYTAIALASLGVNMVLMSVAKMVIDCAQLDFFKVWYLLAQVVIVVFAGGTSFLLNRLITFRDKQQEILVGEAPSR